MNVESDGIMRKSFDQRPSMGQRREIGTIGQLHDQRIRSSRLMWFEGD